MAEMKGFVFAITFILLFSTFIATMPTGLQGRAETSNQLTDIDPSLITDFADTENWTKGAYTFDSYQYSLGGYDWVTIDASDEIVILRKVKFLGIWLGATDATSFFNDDSTNRGNELTLTEINTDATDGAVRYDLRYDANSNDAGGFVVYWNSTEYATAALAWAADELNLLHGIGIDSTAATNIFGLMIALLTFQIPDVPPLIGVIIGAAPWASIIFIAWFIIKESLPFL